MSAHELPKVMLMAVTVADLRPPAPWMSEGACRSEDPELFFPIGEGGASSGQIQQAVSICHGCGVEAQCLRFALINGIKDGIWGGRTEQERHAMVRTRRTRRAHLRPPPRRS
jgi:WhiB family transcriptional regulator, redox-sensing transcriptional regulator